VTLDQNISAFSDLRRKHNSEGFLTINRNNFRALTVNSRLYNFPDG
jgi:hypothetical protein